MVVGNDEVIIKRKSWDEATHRDDLHTAESLILSGFLEKCSLHDGRLFQMILFAERASVFGCYVQRVLIQMELLKLIEVNIAFNV